MIDFDVFSVSQIDGMLWICNLIYVIVLFEKLKPNMFMIKLSSV